MASKRLKISNYADEITGEQITKCTTNVLIYIVPKKISKARVQLLINLARKKGFPITEVFSDLVTHIVTSYETTDKVLGFLKRQQLENMDIVSVDWLTDCTTAGKLVEVTEKVRVKSNYTTTEENSSPLCQDRESVVSMTTPNPDSYQDTKFVCQRAIPLKHHNHKFTDALEVLERHAIYVDTSQRDTRALAFRRAACSLKSYPRQITRIEEAAKLTNIGSHSKKVIQEILESGSSDEVQEILSSDFFKTMEIFSAVYGCGPTTARKWFEKGYRSIADLTKAVEAGMKLTDQQTMGLRYHNDLIQPVSRQEADVIREIVVKELDRVQPNCIAELVGGYRRGKASGHDVDILITHIDDSKTVGLLVKLVERLDKLGHMLHKDLMVGHNPYFESKSSTHLRNTKSVTDGSPRQSTMDQLDHCFCMFQVEGTPLHQQTGSAPQMEAPKSSDNNQESDVVIGRGARYPAPVHRVDLIVTPPKQYAFALLGWTGSKQFNRSLRDYAWKMLKIKLSNHGMWNHNHVPPRKIEASSEHEIFSALELEYRIPENRNA